MQRESERGTAGGKGGRPPSATLAGCWLRRPPARQRTSPPLQRHLTSFRLVPPNPALSRQSFNAAESHGASCVTPATPDRDGARRKAEPRRPSFGAGPSAKGRCTGPGEAGVLCSAHTNVDGIEGDTVRVRSPWGVIGCRR